jgi:sarcosine oxidase subunit delta
MKLINCPLNGPRNAQEFVCGGEVIIAPHPQDASAAEWADYIFLQNNTAGVVREWWCHAASGYWFIGERDTVTDQMLRTYPASDVFAEPQQKEAET